MASRTSIRITLDSNSITRLLSVTTDTSAARAALRVRNRARVLAPHRTGALAASITSRKVKSPSAMSPTTVYSVSSPLPYAGYQEYGTGPIVASKGKVLRFQPKGSSVFIFRPRTRGVPARHYLREAYHSLSLRDYLP